MEFSTYYETVLNRVRPAFSGTVEEFAKRPFVTALAHELFNRYDEEKAILLGTDLILAAMNEFAHSTQDVDYDSLTDPEERLSVYAPFVSESFMDHARYHMHRHNAEKGVTYKAYPIDDRLQLLAIKMEKDGGVDSPIWWSLE